jgi:hypothetical protein
MARARRRDEWDRTANLMSWMARVMTGAKVDPAKLNPFRDDARVRVEDLDPATRRALADRQINALEMMFGVRPRNPRAKKPKVEAALQALRPDDPKGT